MNQSEVRRIVRDELKNTDFKRDLMNGLATLQVTSALNQEIQNKVPKATRKYLKENLNQYVKQEIPKYLEKHDVFQTNLRTYEKILACRSEEIMAKVVEAPRFEMLTKSYLDHLAKENKKDFDDLRMYNGFLTLGLGALIGYNVYQALNTEK